MTLLANARMCCCFSRPRCGIEEKMMIVYHGHEIRSIAVSPQPLMVSAMAKRIDYR